MIYFHRIINEFPLLRILLKGDRYNFEEYFKKDCIIKHVHVRYKISTS